MSLPMPWVEKIFAKLTLTYGRDFLSRWEGQNIAAVMADWAHELAGYQQALNAIKHALSILPADKPPTVIEFKHLCRSVPRPAAPLLSSPKPDPARVAQIVGGFTRPAPRDPKQWAYDLQARIASGYQATLAQQLAIEAALRPVETEMQP